MHPRVKKEKIKKENKKTSRSAVSRQVLFPVFINFPGFVSYVPNLDCILFLLIPGPLHALDGIKRSGSGFGEIKHRLGVQWVRAVGLAAWIFLDWMAWVRNG
jgi:hypothetical protein